MRLNVLILLGFLFLFSMKLSYFLMAKSKLYLLHLFVFELPSLKMSLFFVFFLLITALLFLSVN